MPTLISPKVLSWCSPDLEAQAAEQAARASRLPFIEGHIALMPDAHFGMGATIGSVIPTRGAVIPSAVGVDIGCGMIAARLPLTSKDLPDNLNSLHKRIAQVIPAGVGQGHMEHRRIPTTPYTSTWEGDEGDKLRFKAQRQMGTLGSGNHFVEVCLDEQDRVWIVLHSGSRGVGNQVAVRHIEVAKGLMRQYFIDLEDKDLAYLVQGTNEFRAYIADMLWAQDYAMQNRRTMLDAVLDVFDESWAPFEPVEIINCHHNFTQQESHMGKNVWLTRKGAIKAAAGDRGVIPGSMGTRSYIVSGLGNVASYCSCSHGAGRAMSRTRANKELSYESLEIAMQGKAWNHSTALLDEHPLAYKDIDVVMENQKDLVKIDHTLSQILNYKGA